jgi:hypothetical protein
MGTKATSGDKYWRKWGMLLIIYYVVFMITGDFAAYLIGLFSEREFGSEVSLIVFLTLYFLFLWFSWLLAVWMTKPKEGEEPAVSVARKAP